jgi:hypothetical protein
MSPLSPMFSPDVLNPEVEESQIMTWDGYAQIALQDSEKELRLRGSWDYIH